ncbi:MAG: hypothetical protein CVU79_07350 [Elusimicrobia bacterium HGW-Elusimicrobia-3]|nr:MAG: hypothetical protein CVU79_07350 [Elusimicrobia bacterium HGW-Elusimicrobia-3]
MNKYFLPAILLCAAAPAGAQSISQLEEYGDAACIEVPAAAPVSAEEELDPEALRADFDFLVKPEAEHEPGAELYLPWEEDGGLSKSVSGAKPIPFLAEARAEAEAQGVDLALVLAVIQKESTFNPKARSSAGAVGLMQLLPSTARWLGLKDTSKLTTPAVNIKYGVKYLKFLWGEFGDKEPADLSPEDLARKASRMSIAAYNAGQGNVRKYDDVPPFKETRNYVSKVTEYFAYYEGRLATAP